MAIVKNLSINRNQGGPEKLITTWGRQNFEGFLASPKFQNIPFRNAQNMGVSLGGGCVFG